MHRNEENMFYPLLDVWNGEFRESEVTEPYRYL